MNPEIPRGNPPSRDYAAIEAERVEGFARRAISTLKSVTTPGLQFTLEAAGTSKEENRAYVTVMKESIWNGNFIKVKRSDTSEVIKFSLAELLATPEGRNMLSGAIPPDGQSGAMLGKVMDKAVELASSAK